MSPPPIPATPPAEPAAKTPGALLDRIGGALLLPAAVGLALACWGTFRLLPKWDWAACRLAASVRLAWGFPLYTPPGGTAMNDWIYGPVGALAYTPAALANDPLNALQLATLLNSLYFLLPAIALFGGALRRAETRHWAAWGFVFAVGALLAPFGTWYNASNLHVDTPAIGLGVMSCLALARTDRGWLAASLGALAVWTKQTDAPLVLAQAIYLVRLRGWRAALAYTGRFALVGIGLMAIFCAWFGAGTLWHDMVVIPSRHSLEMVRLGEQLGDFALVTCWIWPVALAAWKWPVPPANASAAAGDRTGWLLLLAALVLLPGGLLATLKIGGGKNSLHSITYLVLGGAALAVRLAQSGSPRHARFARAGLLAGVVAVLGIDLHRVFAFGHLQLADPGRQHREAFDFIRAHPGRSYFPWDTLAHLMAERRDYPFDYGVYDWRLAGAAPTDAEIRGAFPATLEFIIYHENAQAQEMRRSFPDFNRVHRSGEWLVYTRAPATGPAASSQAPAAPGAP